MKSIIGVSSVWSGETLEDENITEDFFYVGSNYTNAIYDLGSVPFILAPITTNLKKEDLVNRIVESVDGLLLSGGGDIGINPSRSYIPCLIEQQRQRYEFEALLIKKAWEIDLPVLGICRGHQMIIEVLGGTIAEQPINGHKQNSGHNYWHNIKIEPSSKLAKICETETWEVNSYHVQAAEKTPVCLDVSAISSDGVIEAVEARDKKFFMGFQFHPEMLLKQKDKFAIKIMQEFINKSNY